MPTHASSIFSLMKKSFIICCAVLLSFLFFVRKIISFCFSREQMMMLAFMIKYCGKFNTFAYFALALPSSEVSLCTVFCL